MEKDLLKNLKELKKIKPDSDYSKQSRFLILQSSPEFSKIEKRRLLSGQFFGNFSKNLVLSPIRMTISVAIIVLMFAVSIGAYYANNQFNQNNFVVKASEMNNSIQVKLNEIKYLLENKPYPDVERALMIQNFLEEAANKLKEIPSLSENKNLDESLEKIELAQEILSQIDLLLKNQE
ncbi:hypothetical protein JW698_03185 [Candidatus Wolfebacteria bacterium]|nr:hypothetical protein [Candidatus Wolfebacteria bacterium]